MKTLNYLLLVSILLLAACGKQVEQNAAPKISATNVNVEVVKPTMLEASISVAGTVKALEDAMLSPEEGGVVKEWGAKKGQVVSKGDVVVYLKDDVIKASYDAAAAQYNIAELNVEKQKKVYDEQGISELQYKNMIYGRDAAKANMDLMKARLDRTQIRAPFDGIIDNIMPNPGEFAPPGVPLARVVNTSVVKIQAEIPELYSGTVQVGMPARIAFDALPADTLRGRITSVGATVSSANRTLMIEIIVSNPYRKLKPEMVAKVRLAHERKPNAILVSENILQLVDRDRTIVYVENGGRAEERIVKTGARQGNAVEIVSGLRAGDRLITVGFQKLVNGSPVIITQ